MKIRSLNILSLVLSAALLLAGCQGHDDAESQTQPTDILSYFGTDGKAWLSLEISLPEPQGTTRANSFDDGTTADQAINSLMLVLFHGAAGTAEADLRVASIYHIGYSREDDDHSQVTHHSQQTFQISSTGISSNDQLFLLAIANATPEITVGQTFSEVAATQSAYTTTVSGTAYYVMSNSPLTSANDGTGAVTTLEPVDPTRFAASAAAATLPACQLFLERLACKVTATTATALDLHVQGNAYIDFTTSDLKYAVDNYNDNSYLVRHFQPTWLPYQAAGKGLRMIEQTALTTERYRTYWAEDINYTGKSGLQRAHSGWTALGVDSYCAENTFDVARQQDDCTTGVLFTLRLNGGSDFYTTSVTGSDVIYQAPQSDLTEEGTGADQSFAPRRSTYVSSAKPINQYLREWLWETNKDFRDWVNQYAAGEVKQVNITLETYTSGQQTALVATVTQKARSGGDGATAFNSLNLVDYLNNNINIKYYYQGYCYYRVPIRHFNDDETPWTPVAATNSNSTSQVYGSGTTAETAYLGRYGMVRNNHYIVEISAVNHIGEPVIMSLTTAADDSVEQLLNANLIIDDWITHEQ